MWFLRVPISCGLDKCVCVCVFVWKRRHPSKNGTFAPKCRPRLPPYLQLYMKLGRFLQKKQHATLHLSQWAWVKKTSMHPLILQDSGLFYWQMDRSRPCFAASLMLRDFHLVMFTSWGFNFGVTDLMDPFPPNTVFFEEIPSTEAQVIFLVDSQPITYLHVFFGNTSFNRSSKGFKLFMVLWDVSLITAPPRRLKDPMPTMLQGMPPQIFSIF